MADEPGHKAMLYFLEVLMNSNGPLTISQLAGRFGSRNFTPEMRSAAGSNEAGLKKFLLKYPSLFTVKGNMVSLFDGSAPSTGADGREGSPASTASTRSLPDVSAEMEAVQYFQNRLIKKEERWVLIKSLAGHLSQASAEIRNTVGPQLDFRKWLLKHPHIFEVQGELVGVRDGIAAITTPNLGREINNTDILSNGFVESTRVPSINIRPVPPKTPPVQRRAPKSPGPLRRSFSFSEKKAQSEIQLQQPTTPVARRRNAPVTMTANEYKAVMFLKDIIEKRDIVKLHSITGHFSQAPEGVRNTIGWSKMELEEFLKNHSNLFQVSEDEVVTLVKNAKLNVIITGSRPQGQSVRTLNGRKGKVFHVAKLWGIIDLGKHEHVFFDKSIMKKPIDDLQKDFKVGETLSFNAVLAPKSSRAKWRATHVWKEHEQASNLTDMEITASGQEQCLSPSGSIEDEINAFLPKDLIGTHASPRDNATKPKDKFADAAPSGAGVVPVWNYRDAEERKSDGGDDLTMVPESFYMCTSSFNELCVKPNKDTTTTAPSTGQDKSDLPQSAAATNGHASAAEVKAMQNMDKPAEPPSGTKCTMDVACQTISTGEILATQLFNDED